MDSTKRRFLLRDRDRWLLARGVKREWKAFTFENALSALEEMRHIPEWKFGVLSYDFGRLLQGIASQNVDIFKTPLLHFFEPREVIIVDELPKLDADFFSADSSHSSISRDEYSRAIDRIYSALRQGETYEVNFSYATEGRFRGDPFAVFLRLCATNLSPYACYFDFSPVTIASCSPECLVSGRLKDGRLVVETRPIKGTAPRGKTFEEDEDLKCQLLASGKDEAELNMIVDLARNDLGRVCEIGSVLVPAHRVLETYSHVHHTVSTVRGLLRGGLDWVDTLEAVFPGGSITGAPKHRTLQIIDALESGSRGFYTGSAGWISPSGEFSFNILIRMIAFQLEQKKFRYHSGGGIVMDSRTESEYQETLDKAAVLREALMLK